MTSQPAPLPAFTIRPFRDTDYAQVAALFRQHDLEFIGSSDFSEATLRADWEAIGFDPFPNVVIAEAANSSVIGFAWLYALRAIPARPSFFCHAIAGNPALVLAALIDAVITRATTLLPRVPEPIRVVLEGLIITSNTACATAMQQAGFSVAQHLLTMLRRFDTAAPDAVPLPDGFRLTSFTEIPDVALWAAATQDGERDQPGMLAVEALDFYIDRTIRMTAPDDFDGSLWLLALDGATPAALCRAYDVSDEYPDVGTILQAASAPAYRLRGLEAALLSQLFRSLHARDKIGAVAYADSLNTAQIAIYEGVHMQTITQWDRYELELRPGIDSAAQ